MKDARVKEIEEKSENLKSMWADSPRMSGHFEMNNGEKNELWITADQYFNDVDYLLQRLADQKHESDIWELKFYRLRNEGVTE